MPDDRGWSLEEQRFLDGEGPPPANANARDRVERFADGVRAWTAHLPPLDARVDDAVMLAVRRRPRARSAGWWRRFVEPRPVALRPVLAAAAAVLLIVLSSAVTTALRQRTAGPVAAGGGTILVRFELVAPDARRVALAGSFNEWSDSTIVFTRAARPGLWTVTVALPPGRHQYLFVVDGDRWIPDPSAHAQVEDEFGQTNSLLVVGPRGVVRS